MISEIQNILKAKKADALFLHWKDPSHFWLLGKELENSYILIPRAGEPRLYKSPLEDFKSNEFKVINLEKKGMLNRELETLNLKRLCINSSHLTLDWLSVFKIRLIEMCRELSYLREIKNKNELDLLRKANELTATCFNELIAAWKRKKFTHESQIVKFIDHFAVENNCKLSFDTIVASEKGAAIPHYADQNKIGKGFCVIDFGMRYKGYNADMTRTVYVGKPIKKEVETYNKLLRIQEAAIKKAIPGMKCSDIHNYVVKELGDDAKYFIHGLGHGTGVEIHELPSLKAESEDILRENNVITIEPGIYDSKRNLGMRIEDSLIVKKNPEILTRKATKKLILI
jgi:Xaa-Pro aminopeptidase